MSILDSLNALTKTLLGVGIVDVWKQAPQTKEASEKAVQLAQKKHLREALIIAEKALAVWSRKPSFWERLIRKLLLGKLLDNLIQQQKQWRYQVAEVDKLAANAKTLLKQDTGDPLETQILLNAIAIYQRCTKILHDDRISRVIKQCQQELQRRQQFLSLVTQAQFQAENRFYKNAIAVYRKAQKLYSTESLEQAIAASFAQVQQEEIYNATLQKVQQAQSEGRLQGAIALLKNALTNFSRSDGLDLLHKLQQTLKGKEQFRQGLAAEKAGDFKAATSLYTNAKSLLPNTYCQIRLALVAIKTQAWATALTHLEAIPGEQAAYLRGFAYAQQEDLQVAYKEWLGLTTTEITKQREILKNISQRQRLVGLQNIEQLIKAENWENAKTESRKFIQKFGSDPLVEKNLNEHIQPRLELEVWQDKNWRIIADKAERSWISQPNITTLHNWAIANYYLAQAYPIKLLDLIFSLSTALANITEDPSLQDVPWLENKPVEFASVSLELKRRITALIDTWKDTNIIEYLNLRDRYRLEVLSLNLMGEPSKWGMKINDIFITPGCYQQYLPQWQSIFDNRINANQKILNSLYTNWGLAMAACLEGDYQRAIQLKPSTTDNSDIAAFAQKFVAYHEGYYQLQQQKWREAIIPLKQAKPEIKVSTDWQEEIDRLCGLQRQAISEFKEHLEFAQFWYDLLRSRDARSYLAEYKAEEIREKIANEQISSATGLRELQKIKEIDNQNPIVIDLIERIEFNQELELIDNLLKSNKFEEVFQRAKKSQHQRLRNIVSDFYVKILIKGFKNRDLGFEDIYKLGNWAYELCPDDPNIQEVYRLSQELKDIENLMKSNRFDEAVHRAKYSQHDSIRYYVADFFINTLLKGIKNRDLSFDLIQQLGRWAYELCPAEPAFKEIYHSLKIS